MMLALVLALSVVTTVSATAGEPGGTVACTDTTYTPSLTYVANSGVVTDVKVYIGADSDSGGDATCEMTETTINGDGSASTPFVFPAFTMASQTCDGVVLTADATTIKFEATATMEVTETFRTKIKRDKTFTFKIECSLTRAVAGIKADGNVEKWTVDRAALSPASKAAVTGTINFPITIKYYQSMSYISEVVDPTLGDTDTKTFVADMGSMLYIQLTEEPASSVLKFVTNECYFNYGTGSDGKDGNQDTFFTSGCMVDKATENNDFIDKASSDDTFQMQVSAFFFTGQENSAIHLWCEVFICLESDTTTPACQQPTGTQCSMVKRRRRRDIRFDLSSTSTRSLSESEGVLETRIIESGQMIMLDKNDIFVPSCGEGFIYNRVTKGCSNTNLVDIIGVYLDIPWENDYANKSSLAFKNLAIEKAYQLYAMVQMSEAKNHIVGLEVIEAKKGSVILTVRVKYSAMSNADAAFEGFSRAIQNVDQTRVANILNIRKEKVIEFVEVKPSSVGGDQNLTVIIVVVVVLCVAILISIVAVWKVKVARGIPNSNMQVKAHDNPTMVTVN